MDKSELRRLSKEIRKTLNISEISSQIAEILENLPEYKEAKNVLLFYPKEYEINLLSLAEKYQREKKFYLPRVEGENLIICPYDSSVNMEISDFGIKEPCSEPVNPQIIDCAIIPCLCADKRGYRIGYGKGFYDRFIPFLRTDCTKICPVPDKLLYDKIDTDEFDIPVNYIITEKI